MKTFVIHPDRLKERGEHIDRMMKGLSMKAILTKRFRLILTSI